ncbi:MAG: NfeD family protein [Chthoniobacteraceae bacterium]
MNWRRFLCWLGLVIVCIGSPAPALQAAETVVVPIHGEISRAQFYFLRRALKEAEAESATAVILDLDTYGGELSAATEMLDALSKTSIPTIAYVNTNAGSAGALISLGTRKIYMAPVSAIGAAAPVMGGGEDLPSTMNDKVVSYFSGYFRSAASRNGYNPDLAEAFMNKAKEVKVGNEIVHPSGSLLTLGAQEATRMVNGKPLLAIGIASSIEDLVEKEKLPANIQRIEQTGFETLALWLTTLAPLLLLGGIIGAYIEMKTPGFGAAGTVSIICFGAFFAGQYLAGLSGWEVGMVFVIGLVLVAGELFVHPGTIIPGLVGMLLMLGSLVWAMLDRYPHEPLLPTAQMLQRPLGTLLLTIVLSVAVLMILARWLPKSSLFRVIALQQANPTGPSLEVVSPGLSHLAIGTEGVAVTILRPSGKARIGPELVDVITDGEFVQPSAPVRIVQIAGSRIVVKPVG